MIRRSLLNTLSNQEQSLSRVWEWHEFQRVLIGGVLNLRHWLAHGRYWKPKLGRVGGYDVVNVFDICTELLQAIGLTP